MRMMRMMLAVMVISLTTLTVLLILAEREEQLLGRATNYGGDWGDEL